jgi:lysozyme
MPIINAVVDLSHHNGNVDFIAAKKDGILGIIHKATQGSSSTDPMYITNRGKALDAGLLWGAYHFGTGDDAVAQADHFLAITGTDPKLLRVLDFEPNLSGASMSLDQAHAFVIRIKEVTGRYPGFYSGSYIKQLLGNKQDPVLVNCWFWLAEYGPNAIVPPNWSTWTMWQYTDGTTGADPNRDPVAGIGKCDRDKFNGSEDQLQNLWVT